MQTLLVIPTYNERENVENLIQAVHTLLPEIEILIVDDNSPDGTADLIRSIAARDPRVHLLWREKKAGLGRAYVAGFSWGLERGYDVLVEMDADFSHRPVDLVELLKKIPEFDFAMGSRWTEGGSTRNWSWFRRFISKGGSFYSRLILGYPVHDWTGGFTAWKSDVLKGIDLLSVQSEGYSFQIELKFRALRRGFRGIEVPIVFEDRRLGQSKMSSKIVLEALYRVWYIRNVI